MLFFSKLKIEKLEVFIISFLYRKSYICWMLSKFSKMPTITGFPRLFQPIASHLTIWQNINNWKKKKNLPEIYPEVLSTSPSVKPCSQVFCALKCWVVPQWCARGSLTHYLERLCGSFLGFVFCLRNDLPLYFNFSL